MSDNPFDVPEGRYVLPPEPRFHGDGSSRPVKRPDTITLYDGKPWDQLSTVEKIEFSRNHKLTVGSQPVAQEQLFYVKLRLVPAGANYLAYREFEDVVSVKYEDQWMFIFDKTGHWTFPRDRVIEVQTTRQP